MALHGVDKRKRVHFHSLPLVALLLQGLCDFYYSLLAASPCILRVVLADEADTPLFLSCDRTPRSYVSLSSDTRRLLVSSQTQSSVTLHSRLVTDSAGNTSASLHVDLIRPYDILLEARTHITVVRAKTEGNFRTRLHDLQCMMDDPPSLAIHQFDATAYLLR